MKSPKECEAEVGLEKKERRSPKQLLKSERGAAQPTQTNSINRRFDRHSPGLFKEEQKILSPIDLTT
jgi:hypothetical protein